MVPPTSYNPIFSSAKQRIYLSATLGAGGELERAFGRKKIDRLSVVGHTPPRSGRRLFVFPDLAAGDDALGLVKSIVQHAGKAIVLSQDTVDAAQAAATEVATPGMAVFGKRDVEQNLSVFKDAPEGVLGLANRYDGLDLPDDDCRLVVLKGLPAAQNLQEKFLGERADSSAAIAERVRTRVVQGAGRCTRGPSDYAVVVIAGSQITRYFSRPEVLGSLDPEFQAEVEFGWLNSLNRTHAEILENVEVFLEHEQPWRDGGEPFITEIRHSKQLSPPLGSDAMQASAPIEVGAWELAFQSNWISASHQMEAAAQQVGQGNEATRGYRALLLFLAGLWLQYGAVDESARARARQLVRQAEAAATRGAWLSEMPRFAGDSVPELEPADAIAVAEIAARLEKGMKSAALLNTLETAIVGLGQKDHVPYEQGLTTIGLALGARAFKPQTQGRCDSAWLWGTARWLTIEAKSEESEEKTISIDDIRQATAHLAMLASDEGLEIPPIGSVSVIASPRSTVSPDAIPAAGSHLYVAELLEMTALAADVKAVWTVLAATTLKGDSHAIRATVAATLADFGCLPSQVVDRLTGSPVNP